MTDRCEGPVCILAHAKEATMTQILAHFDQTNSGGIANLPVSRVAWRFLRILCSTTNRGFLALVNFWNIPKLGENETRESQYFRTKYYI